MTGLCWEGRTPGLYASRARVLPLSCTSRVLFCFFLSGLGMGPRDFPMLGKLSTCEAHLLVLRLLPIAEASPELSSSSSPECRDSRLCHHVWLLPLFTQGQPSVLPVPRVPRMNPAAHDNEAWRLRHGGGWRVLLCTPCVCFPYTDRMGDRFRLEAISVPVRGDVSAQAELRL